MKLNDKAFVKDGKKNIYTHMVFAAHPDDVEIMCGDGIIKCYDDDTKGLVAVIVGDGAGSPRSGPYADFDDNQMINERRMEQVEAAEKGNYARLIMLNYPSKTIAVNNQTLIDDILQILKEHKPAILYSHNPADKHNTHVNVLKCVLTALRQLPKAERPKYFYGCECWRDLDWLSDKDKMIFNLSGYGDLLTELLLCHRSQVAGGKRYDLAAHGRRLANATFHRSHNVDTVELANLGMDLTPLIKDDAIDLRDFIEEKIENFKKEILV